MPRSLFLAALVVGCASATAQPLAPSASESEGTQRALLVAINTYNPPGSTPLRRISDLRGPLNDVRLMQQVLQERGFDAAHIDTLTEGDATRVGIERAVTDWIGEAAPGDHLTFYFSGHGSWVDTTWVGLDGEIERRLETIVPADAAGGGADIVDKTLRMWWNAALTKVQEGGAAGTLTVIQDNCHSGSGSRGGMLAREAQRGTTVVLPDPARVGGRPDARGALLISAARETQKAWETDVPGVYLGGESAPHGVFTVALARALRATPQGMPAQQVFDLAVSHVGLMLTSEDGRTQDGVLEGPSALPLFGEPLVPGGGATFVVDAIDGDEVVLRGGMFAGLGEGASVVRDWTADGERDSVGVALGIIGANESRSRAHLPEGEEVQVGDRFRITRYVPAGTPLLLWIPSQADDLAASAHASISESALSSGARGAAVSAFAADSSGSFALTQNPVTAHYWLLGGEGDEVRWLRTREAMTGNALDALPAIEMTFAGSAAGGDQLLTLAQRLAKIHRWTSGIRPPAGHEESFPLQVLGMQRVSDGLVLRADTSGVLTIPPAERSCYDVDRPEYRPEDCYQLAVGMTSEAYAEFMTGYGAGRVLMPYAYSTVVGPNGDACLLLPFIGCDPRRSVSSPRLNLSDAATLRLAQTTAGDSVWVATIDGATVPFTFRTETGRNTVVLLTSASEFERAEAELQWSVPTAGLVGAKGRGPFDVAERVFPTWGLHRIYIDVVPGAPHPAPPSD